MMPIWFLVLLALCAPFAVITATRGIKGNGTYIAGQKVSRLTIVLAAIVIVIAVSLLAATQLGFIPNHAP